MQHPIAETIDVCMEKLFAFVTDQYSQPIDQISSVMIPVDKRKLTPDQLYKILLKAFELYVLPTHKTVHVQFVMFYICSFKVSSHCSRKKLCMLNSFGMILSCGLSAGCIMSLEKHRQMVETTICL